MKTTRASKKVTSRDLPQQWKGPYTRAMGLSMMVARARTKQSLWEITPIRSSRVQEIGHGLQHEGSPTAVVDHDAVLRIHRPDGYKISPALVLKNTRTVSISLDT